MARRWSPSAVPLDVNRVLNGLAEFLRRSLGEEVSLEIVGGGGVWPVEADPAELEAAALNLALNARDAMPNGGKLTVEASNSVAGISTKPIASRTEMSARGNMSRSQRPTPAPE